VPKTLRVLLGAAVAIALGTVATVAAIASPAAHKADAPVVTIVYGTAPDYLDPDKTYTTQGGEATWVSYLGLYTYAHKSGNAGGVVIPALATALPVVTDGGKTYTMTLRKNLVYSNGKPVVASDFTYGIERSLKLTWGGDSFFTGNIVGAAAYATGKASTISGITTDDATGKIVVHLLAPYGAFLNVMAFPSAALIPAGTAMTDLTNDPPPGVGPYMITDVVPDKSWVGAINPYYAKEAIPGIPAASVTVDAKVESDTATETEDVLNNTDDLFDTGDSITPSLLPQIKSTAASRYKTIPVVQNFYFFLNVTEKPFNSQLVREAVDIAVDRRVLAKLSGGTIQPGCFFLPPGMIGHPTGKCPYGINPDGAPDLAKAKALVKQSGDEGAAVTVYSEERVPRTQYCQYWASVLNSIGLKATIKPIADALYFPTIGTLKLHPQTGFADWDEDFPNPGDFYLLLDKRSITPTNGLNYGQVDDPKIQNAIEKLDAQPAADLPKLAGDWMALDEYTAKKAYDIVFGYQTWPEFTSTRIDFSKLIVQPSYGWDWTSIHLNS
jgi:peptide/nickel transport system substrate-binding protein